MNKYTPGPWRLDDPINAHVLGDDIHVIDAGTTLNPGGFSLSGFMSEPDARLIVAAPDMAELLRQLQEGGSLSSSEWSAIGAVLTKAGL